MLAIVGTRCRANDRGVHGTRRLRGGSSDVVSARDEDWRSVCKSNGALDALLPRMPSGMKNDLQRGYIPIADTTQRGQDAQQWIERERARRRREGEHELAVKSELDDRLLIAGRMPRLRQCAIRRR